MQRHTAAGRVEVGTLPVLLTFVIAAWSIHSATNAVTTYQHACGLQLQGLICH